MIKILFLDVDGCLSDGGIYTGANGELFKRFDVKDGFALEQWNTSLGGISAIITGKSSDIALFRAKELGVKYCFQGVKNKLEKAKEILAFEALSFDEAAVIGDDLNDICLLKAIKNSYAPNNATKEAKSTVKTVLQAKGGYGAVREMIEDVLELNGQKQAWIKGFVG
ncbi:MAG: HAD hydrolase family protein [Campylobacter sp.]|uniref:KdsC family phosphatase n=1 Tax=Campylobacter sp. TaxID=205 RepID=UPI002A91AB59|nr:HAD hydrolase family protein [Campylobacter sp.]MDY6187505.1 HAD hydrolase family protein [Campylobacter sp.]